MTKSSLRHIALVDGTAAGLPPKSLTKVAAALTKQVSNDAGPVWGVQAQVQAVTRGASAAKGAWPITVLDVLDTPGAGGVHLDHGRHPYAQVLNGSHWTLAASHELLEMLVDPYGHRFVQGPSIDPTAGGRNVFYLVEVADPCEVFTKVVSGIVVSDFVTPEYYRVGAPAAAEMDALGHLREPFEVPPGCYLSWLDPSDHRWHQKRPDGSFVTATAEAPANLIGRAARDAVFAASEPHRHDLAFAFEGH